MKSWRKKLAALAPDVEFIDGGALGLICCRGSKPPSAGARPSRLALFPALVR
ncbi:MAG: hypothetical protein IPN96_08645 [Anaerolineales bacterium]|nr:hypothetical protein [Anaerolineales bacterium]